MTKIRSIGVLSLAKIMGFVYGLLGLIIGGFVSILTLFGINIIKTAQSGPESLVAILGVLLLPIIYGCVGFIGGIIVGFLFNLAAGWVGGLEVKTQ